MRHTLSCVKSLVNRLLAGVQYFLRHFEEAQLPAVWNRFVVELAILNPTAEWTEQPWRAARYDGSGSIISPLNVADYCDLSDDMAAESAPGLLLETLPVLQFAQRL